MYLEKLTLINFKNYAEAELEFHPDINCFTGNNGAGKTNLLDAVHYLSLCKSYFNPIDSQQIKHEQDFFMIQGIFHKNNEQDTIYCGLKRNQKKQLKRNKKEYNRLAEHIGLYPLVMISPNDSVLITDGSEERRKFMDVIISQINPSYLNALLNYNKMMEQRNGLLRRCSADNMPVDWDLLSIYDEQLIQNGTYIYQERKNLVEDFTLLFHQYYKEISRQEEPVHLTYVSPLHDTNFEEGLMRNRQKDLVLSRTSFGIHKDDIDFKIYDYPLKKNGSQGQQKTFLIALKLAQYNYIYQKNGFKPLLLLDDIFDKLDSERVQQLISLASKRSFGQVFITDTHAERVKNLFADMGQEVKLFKIEQGKLYADFD